MRFGLLIVKHSRSQITFELESYPSYHIFVFWLRVWSRRRFSWSDKRLGDRLSLPTCTSEGSRATRSGGCTRAVRRGIATSWTACCGPGGGSRIHHFPPKRSLGGGLRRRARGAFSPARLASRGHRQYRLAGLLGSSVTWPTLGSTAASVSRGRWELKDVRRSSAARLAAALSALPKRHPPLHQVPPPSRLRAPAPRVRRVRAVSSSCPRCRR